MAAPTRMKLEMLRSPLLQRAPYRAAVACPLLAIGLVAAGCSASTDEREDAAPRGPAAATTSEAFPEDGAVLYGIGLSTDPYGSSSADGFGVATGLLGEKLNKTEVRGRNWCTFYSSWLREGRILVPRYAAPTCGRPIVFRYQAGRLEREGGLSLPREVWSFSPSPDGRLIAGEPSEPCCNGGARPSGRILVARPDGSDRREVSRGHLAGWTPEGWLVYSTGKLFEFREGDYRAVDLRSGKETTVLARQAAAKRASVPAGKVGVAAPSWSADGRYLAARVSYFASQGERPFWAIVVGRADGRIIRLIRSAYATSMLAWSPRGHRLAYTTSGFPDPHELFVLDAPEAKPRRLFATARHFDWITWSPDGRLLLLDDEHAGRWRLVPAFGDGERRTLPRLGGRPLWCCPQNPFSAGS